MADRNEDWTTPTEGQSKKRQKDFGAQRQFFMSMENQLQKKGCSPKIGLLDCRVQIASSFRMWSNSAANSFWRQCSFDPVSLLTSPRFIAQCECSYTIYLCTYIHIHTCIYTYIIYVSQFLWYLFFVMGHATAAVVISPRNRFVWLRESFTTPSETNVRCISYASSHMFGT